MRARFTLRVAVVLEAFAGVWLLALLPAHARLAGPVCDGRSGSSGAAGGAQPRASSYCSCKEWGEGHAAYVGFVDEAAEVKAALAAAAFNKE